jgi:hypothetical protein
VKALVSKTSIVATVAVAIAMTFTMISPSIAQASDITTPAEATAVAHRIAHDNPLGANATPASVPVDPSIPIAIHASLPDATINVPSDPSKPTTTTTDSGVTISLTNLSASRASHVAEGAPGVAVSDANNGSMIATVITHTGLSNDIVINSPDALTSYSTRITLSRGQSIKSAPGGGYEVVDRKGKVSAIIGAPWAKDAKGAAVPTHYRLRGDVLTQVVNFHRHGTVLPVTADPFWSYLGNYFACILGVGVPVGAAIAFVTYIGAAALYIMATNAIINFRPGGPSWVSAVVRPYVRVVYNNCRRFIQS